MVGVRNDTLSTMTQFMTMSVATTMTKMRYLPNSGTLRDVSGVFWAIRNKKTVWASRTLMETVHFWPPAGGSAW